MQDRSGEMKVYFSGEFDSNQTEFEKKSNHLEIGVMASTKIEGLILLRLLRIIVDKNYRLLLEDISFDWKEIDGKEVLVDYINKKQRMIRIMKRLAKKEKQYITSFKTTDQFTVKLYGRNGKRTISC
jgi:hypothetical protein